MSRGDPTPLKRYFGLLEVKQTVDKASARPGGPWKLLSRLSACFNVLEPFQTQAEQLDDRVYTLQQIAMTFKFTGTAAQIEDKLQSYLDRLKASLKEDQSAWWQQFVKHVLLVSERFWNGLFHSYDVPGLPRTNNSTECFFGALKRFHRRKTGRQSTSGGPIETCPEFFLEALSFLKGRTQEEINACLKGVHPSEIEKASKEIQNLAEPSRFRRSVARNTGGTLDKILKDWRGTLELN